jgi:hypothetical protein
MARREIDPDPEYGKRDGFLKLKEVFPNVGDEFVALYQSDAPNPNPDYGHDYTWKLKTGEIKTMSVKGELHEQLQKAKLQQGEKVKIKFFATKSYDKPGYSPKRLFKVWVDDPPAGTAPAPKPAPAVDDSW